MHSESRESTFCEEAREAMSDKNRDRGQEQGFALILAILSLMLLTFLGLALATQTSTELRIATNYRWNMQALYNAEAGIEAGKRVLQTLNWDQALPPARGPWTVPTTITTSGRPANPTGGLASSGRNWEMWDCDKQGNAVGYGVVLWDGTNAYENITVVPSFASAPALNGAFTLWVRRPVQPAAAGQYQDDPNGANMILTAEGVAPYTAASGSGAAARNNQARRIIEVALRRQSQPTPCDTRGGQIGGGPEGNNVFGGPCTGLDLANAADNATFAPGTKDLKTP
jgi:Tfp pilus assembly protein PilX